jgi:hypothetical protein
MDLYKKYNRLFQMEKKYLKDLKRHEKKLDRMGKAIDRALGKNDEPTHEKERPLRPIPEKYLKKIKK